MEILTQDKKDKGVLITNWNADPIRRGNLPNPPAPTQNRQHSGRALKLQAWVLFEAVYKGFGYVRSPSLLKSLASTNF